MSPASSSSSGIRSCLKPSSNSVWSTLVYATPSYNLSSTEATTKKMSPKLLKSKEYINTHAICLQEEITQFIDFQFKLNGVKKRPRLPMFFVKSYNFLKNKANGLKLNDPQLDSIPNAIKIKLFGVYGLFQNYRNFPRHQIQTGLLDDKQKTIAKEVDILIKDIIDYIEWSYRIDGFVPLLPKAYFLTLDAFEQRLIQEEYTEEELEEFFERIQERLQKNLSTHLPERDFDNEYVIRCTSHYNKTRNPGQLNILKRNDYFSN